MSVIPYLDRADVLAALESPRRACSNAGCR